ncbi:MAG: hypothetical protein EBQ96_08605 [Proteobacteria bacterium]|nr:hypothetical protein [Pseudomonadota bacterium]
MSDLIAKLNKALKPKGTSGPQGTFRHENEAEILDAAKKLLAKSHFGRELLTYADTKKLEMHVLRNKKDFGYLPENSAIYISCPAGQSMPPARAVIHLAGAIRKAYQEVDGSIPTPSVQVGRERFSRQLVEKSTDSSLYQTIVVYELVQNTGLLEILDEFDRMGYRSLYEAYALKQAEPEGKKEE